jgi:hypothetical protein
MTKKHIIYCLAPFGDHQFRSRSQRRPHSRRRAPPPLPHRNLSSTTAAIACRITCLVSVALSYGKRRNGRKGRPPSLEATTIRLAATAPGRILKIPANTNQPTYSPPGRRRRPALGAPSSRLSLNENGGNLGLSYTQARRFICVKVVDVWLRPKRTSIRRQ